MRPSCRSLTPPGRGCRVPAARVTAASDELRRVDHRLLLGAEDIDRLAPAVEAWQERGARPESVIAVLTANPPPQISNPAGLIAHRLTAQLPPPLEPVRRAPAFVPPDPFQTCQTCDLAFRAPAPGHCHSCHPDLKETAWHEGDNSGPRAHTRSRRRDHRPER